MSDEKVYGAFIALTVCDYSEISNPLWIRASCIREIDAIVENPNHTKAKAFICYENGKDEEIRDGHWIVETPAEILKLIETSVCRVNEELAKKTALHLKLSPNY